MFAPFRRMFPPILLIIVTATFHTYSSPAGERDGEYCDFLELSGKRIGILTGTVFDYVVNESLDYTQLVYFDDLSDMTNALLSGEIDCIVDDEPVLHYAASRDPRLFLLPDRIRIDYYGFAFRRDAGSLRHEFDLELAAMLNSGTIEGMVEKWMAGKGEYLPPSKGAPGKKTLRLGAFTETPPFAYQDDRKRPVGLDIEIVTDICQRLEYGLEIIPMGFDELFDAVDEKRVDLITGCITITEERKRQVDFTIPYYEGGASVLVRAK